MDMQRNKNFVRESQHFVKSYNVVDLIKRNKSEQKKDKVKNIIFVAVAFSAIALSGFIISY